MSWLRKWRQGRGADARASTGRQGLDTRAILAPKVSVSRSRYLQWAIAAGFVVLAGRALYLQGVSNDFLQQQGEIRHERTYEMPAMRGKIVDRNGVVLASSVPASTIGALPGSLSASDEDLDALADLLGEPSRELRRRLTDADRSYVVLRRQIPADVASAIRRLDIKGITIDPTTRRIYPQGDVMAHVLGFNDFSDQGQEGVELAFNQQLQGQSGSRRVLRDRLGRVIEDLGVVREPADGEEVRLALDSRIQYLVYDQLREALEVNQARSGSAVVLDVQTGEILAMVSLPAFDPNDRSSLSGDALRNRTLTDAFEPGSTMKPFSVGLALDQRRITPSSTFNIHGGRLQYAGHTITDISRSASLDVTGILQKSSNVGMTQISERLASRDMWTVFSALGLGQAPQIGFPGATAGRLRPWESWRPIEKATMSYGYGLSLSLMQLARAYMAFARDGDVVSLSLVRRDGQPTTVPVYTPETARVVRGMLEVAAGAARAQVPGYRVAGKSGTARRLIDGVYSRTRYVASFAGFAPASDPRIVVAVRVDDPGGAVYYGGRVAAPVFSGIVGGTLRLLGVPPDAPFDTVAQVGAATPRRAQ